MLSDARDLKQMEAVQADIKSAEVFMRLMEKYFKIGSQELDEKNLIGLIKDIHKICSRTALEGYEFFLGEYRNRMTYSLRVPPDGASYYRGSQFDKIKMFLERSINLKAGVYFLYGYYKLIFLPQLDVQVSNREAKLKILEMWREKIIKELIPHEIESRKIF